MMIPAAAGTAQQESHPVSLRSLLFVPADSPAKLDKARTLRPDALILDLEDGVAPERKEAARRTLAQALPALTGIPALVLVRVNSPRGPQFAEDLHAAAAPPVRGIVLPKMSDPAEVADIGAVLTHLEEQRGLAPGLLRLLPSVESAAGVVNAAGLVRASPRCLALLFGGEDYCADMGLARTRDAEEIAWARAAIAHGARAAGVEAIDTVFTDLNDEAGLEEDTRRARRLGMAGRQLIHPRQIAPVHQAFAPDAASVAWAERVLEAFASAASRGSGVAVVDGRMVDRPVALQAQRILSRRT